MAEEKESLGGRGNRKRMEELEQELLELEKPQEVEEETKEEDPEPVSKEEETWKKRHGDHRRWAEGKFKEYQEKIDELERKLSSKPETSQINQEDVEAYIKDNPKGAEIIRQLAAQKAQEQISDLQSQFEKLNKERESFTREQAQRKIREAHDDWDEIVNSDDFHDWATEQAKWVKDGLYENEDDPDSVITIVDLYKMKRNLTPRAKAQERKEAASDVPAKGSSPDLDNLSVGKKTWKESDIKKMSIKDYEKLEKEIDEAMREGRIVMDLTGGAR